MPPVKKPVEGTGSSRPVLYPKVTVCGIEIPEAATIQTVEQSMELLGWQTESDHEAELTKGVSEEVAKKMKVKFGDDFDLIDMNGEKVRLKNNRGNRELNIQWCRTLGQDILNRNWQFNGESWVVGEFGSVLSLQHRGIAHVFAEQMRLKQDEAGEHWRELNPDPITLRCLVVRGIKETPEVIRTLDNVRPRTFSDVLFTDPRFFGKVKSGDKKAYCSMTDYAVRMVWYRTGSRNDPFSPKWTHSEGLKFLDDHLRIVKAVKHVFTENNANKTESPPKAGDAIKRFYPPGLMAGLMYLFGASATDSSEYHDSETPGDKSCNWSNWEKAEAFVMLLASNSEEFSGVRKALAQLSNPFDEEGWDQTPSIEAKTHVLVNAWNEYVNDGKLTPGNLKPEYSAPDDNGFRHIVGTPSCGGIDLGDPDEEARRIKEKAKEKAAADKAEAQAKAEKAKKDAALKAAKEPSADKVDEIEKRKATVKAESLQAKKDEDKLTALDKANPSGKKPPVPKKPAAAGLRGGT